MVRRPRNLLVGVVFTCLALAACGGKSPSAPSSTGTGGDSAPGPAPAGSATVAGLVVAQGSASALPGVTVTVVGTSVSAVADGGGRFSLSNVPSGNQQLEFTGNGAANARVPVEDIQEQERIEVTVEVTGGSAQVLSEERGKGAEAQVEGQITSIDAGARSFQIGTITVLVPDNVPIRHGSTELTFSNLHVNDRVHVKGTKANGVVTATEVNVQDGEDTPGGGGDNKDTVTLSGAVDGLGGSCPDIHFKLGDKTIHASGSTKFVQGTCQSVAEGTRVDVIGTESGSTVTARVIKVMGATGGEGGGKGKSNVSGAVSGLSGQCPTLTFQVQDTTVTTNNSTTFVKGTCSDVANGRLVEAEGTLNGSTLAASKVAIQKD